MVPIVITDEKIEEVRRALPELQDAKIERFVSEYGLSREDATILLYPVKQQISWMLL